MNAEELLAAIKDDEGGVMITPEIFGVVVEVWMPSLVFVEAGQDGELYVRDIKWKPVP